MNLIGQKIFHETYGEGRIIDITFQNLSVLFIIKEKEVEKNFSIQSLSTDVFSFDDDTVKTEFEKEILKLKEEQKTSPIRNAFRINEIPQTNSSPNIENRSAFFAIQHSSLKEEIDYLQKKGARKYKIVDGIKIKENVDIYYYSFVTSTEINLPNNTEVRFYLSSNQENYIPGYVTNCDDLNLTIALYEDFGKKIDEAEFSPETYKLLEELQKRLGEIEENPSYIVNDLILEGKNQVEDDCDIVKGQENALERALNESITFIWGPPGTGKTETLANIALAHVKKGNRVLMLSYSNVSVDGATLRVNKNAKGSMNVGEILRFGYPRDEELLNNQNLTTYNLAIQRRPELKKRAEELKEEKKTLKREDERSLEIEKELQSIRNNILAEEKYLVSKARFIATTVTKAVVDSTIYAGEPFDVVIFDEASMAYIPQIIFSASLARTNFICMGDFAQLPPIKLNENPNSILGVDIFKYEGITDAVYANKNHEWLCLLDEQHRMTPEIAAASSASMYKDLLVSAPNMQEDRLDIVKSSPFIDLPIGMVDIEGIYSRGIKDGTSHLNIASAFLTMSMAAKAAEKMPVGVITPYHSQSRFLNAMARDIEETGKIKKITCATVHAFQGSEQDMIFYDATDHINVGRSGPGYLLTSLENNIANRLFNVALTRAKGKFIAVANPYFLRYMKDNLIFKRLINYVQKNEFTKSIKNKNLSPEIKNNFIRWAKYENIKEDLLNNITQAKEEILIDIPNNLKKDTDFFEKLASCLKQAQMRNLKVIVRGRKDVRFPQEINSFVSEADSFFVDPIIIIDREIIYYGVPKMVSKEDEIYPVFRFIGKNTAKDLISILKMQKVITPEMAMSKSSGFMNYVETHCVCETCGRSMKLLNSYGKFFLGCSGYPKNCQAGTKLVEINFVKQYIEENGLSHLKAGVGKSGVYIINQQTGKYQRLNEI